MTEKIPYIFRQNTDFFYFTGCLEPDSAVVIHGASDENFKSELFVKRKDAKAELWDGPRTGKAQLNGYVPRRKDYVTISKFCRSAKKKLGYC